MRKHRVCADRLKNIRTSAILHLLSSSEHKSSFINLAIGEIDYTPPTHVQEALNQAVADGRTRYSAPNGIPELREAIAKKSRREYGLDYDSESEVLVTIGATEAVTLALLTCINPGDEVLMFDPGFVCYKPSVLIAGGLPIEIPMTIDRTKFKLDVEAVTSHITEKTRAVIVNSPNNPTGSVFACDELARLAEIVVENDLLLISDEVYEKIIYDNAKHHCLAALPDMHERTIVVNSFSKTYAMTGFRVGYALGPEDIVSGMLLVHESSMTCVSEFIQYAALAALEGPQTFVSAMVAELDQRRRFIHKRLNEIEGFNCSLPEGAFYVFPSVKTFGTKAADLSDFLLEVAKVAVTPGSVFGKTGEGFLRLSFGLPLEKINEALSRIELAVRKREK